MFTVFRSKSIFSECTHASSFYLVFPLHIFAVFIFENLLTLYSFFQSDEMGKYVFISSHISELTSKNFLCIVCSKIVHGHVNP